MADPAIDDMKDDVAVEIALHSPIPQTTVNRAKKGAKTDNPYGDANYCKGSLDVLKRLGAGKKYVAR